jgi:predicted N-formylglutamate amidohydrolase
MTSNRPTIIVTIHSFTPIFKGKTREVDIGIVHDTDARLADVMCADHGPMAGLDIQRNEPYGPDRGVTHTLKVHGIERGLQNVMIEVRNNLVEDEAGQAKFAVGMAEWLDRSVKKAVRRDDPMHHPVMVGQSP